jgi:hypothetical protein
MNKTLSDFGRKTLKELLAQCTWEQQHFFKRMYSHKNLEASIDECVDNMDESKIDWAITQCEKTVEKNRKKIRDYDIVG